MANGTIHEKDPAMETTLYPTKADEAPVVTGSQTPREHTVAQEDVDDTSIFYNLNKDKVGPLTSDVKKRLVRKNFWFLLGQTWCIAFLIHLDKSTLSQATTMGIFEDVAMTKKLYND